MEESNQAEISHLRGNNYKNLTLAALGAAIGISLALWLAGGRNSPFLLASLGGSTVFLFVLSETEAAQPRALFGGHIGASIIGIICFRFLGDALWVSAVAVVLTMVFMVVTRTIHPPAGANPLFMVHNHASFPVLLNPVGAGVLILFLVALLWSRIWKANKYPTRWW